MDKNTFEQLLYEGEGVTLDFKSQQYVLDKSDPDASSELLKDILGFANAIRRSEAFILIGVREVVGAKAEVLGIPSDQHLADHT